MSEKEPQAQLANRLARAAEQVSVDARYLHYRGFFYTVVCLALREEDNEPCVVYRAEYGDRLTFVRPVKDWVEEIEVDGQKVRRFDRQ